MTIYQQLDDNETTMKQQWNDNKRKQNNNETK